MTSKLCNKKFGNKIFSKLIEELKFLQENGITVSNEKIYFKVGLISGDNLGIVLPELQRFYGRAIVIITPVEMPISDINRPLSIFIFVLYLSVYRVVLGRIYD
jgi:hypothetical protein